MRTLNPLAFLPLILTQPLLHAGETPTVVSKKITPAYVAGNSDVTHVAHTPDSSRALYVQSTDGSKTGTLYSVLLTGGDPVALLDNVPGDPESPGFRPTPDSTRVIAHSGTTLYSIPVGGGTAIALFDGIVSQFHLSPETNPSFAISPDSQTVAAIANVPGAQFNPFALHTVPVLGGQKTIVSEGTYVAGWIRFSADSKTVYFQGVHNETTLPPVFFYQAPADGSIPAEPITFEPNPGPGPRWPIEGGANPTLLPDRSAIVYLATPGNNGFSNEVRIIDLATRTGSTLASSNPGTISSWHLSHDGSHLFVTRGHFNGSLQSINIAARSETFLAAAGADPQAPILSPDATTVVYLVADQVLAQSPDGGPATNLSLTGVVDLDATHLVGITPDSTRVVFLATIDQAGPPQLFSNTLDGTDLRRLTSPVPEDRHIREDPFITADGSHVIYRADLYYQGDDYLFSVPTVGGGSLLLHHATVPARDVDAVLETPDGTGVTFIADLNSNSVDELFHRRYDNVANDTLRLSQPGTGSGDGRLSQFRLTPDSRFAVFRAQARSPGVDELFATSTTGGPSWRLNQDLVISGDVRSDAFAITPDSTHVVYRADADLNATTELYITTIATPSDPLKLHPDLGPDQDISAFAVSPDNLHIAVRGDIDNQSRHELYLVKRDATDLTKINPPLANGRDVRSDFNFSPDGNYIAFLSAPPGDPTANDTLYLYHVPSATLEVVIDRDPALALPTNPRFSPDSKTLALHALNNIGTRVHLAPVDTDDLFPTGINPPGDAISRQWMFTSDGAFLVANDLSFTNLVAIPVDGTAPRVLDSPEARAQSFTVAPHTGHVVAVYGSAPQFTMVSIPIDGSPRKTLHTHDGHLQPYGPIVTSADGRSAIFTIENELHVAPLSGPNAVEPVAPGFETDPASPAYTLSPDGRDIYVVARSAESTGAYSLYNFSLDHDTLTRITPAPGIEPSSLTLTQDGHQAIYVAAATTPAVRDLYATQPATLHTSIAEAATQDTTAPGFVDTTAQTAVYADAAQPSSTGLRFPSIKIDPGTRVHAAHITFTAASSTGASRDILFDNLAAPDTPPFVHGPGFDVIDRRDAIPNVVPWRVGPWVQGTAHTSPDLTPLFDALFSIEGWQPSNAAGFITFSRLGSGDPHTVHLAGPTPPRLEIITLGDLGRGPVQRLSFPAWAAAHGIDADPASDGDTDSIPLLAEYAFDLDPTRSDSPPAPIISFSAADNGDFAPTVTYVHPPSRTSTDLTLESSTDLRTWTPIAVTRAGANTIALGDAFVSELPFPDNFLTAQVSLPVVTGQTATVHFRFRITLARP